MAGQGDANQDVTLRFQGLDVDKVLQDIDRIEAALTRLYSKAGSSSGPIAAPDIQTGGQSSGQQAYMPQTTTATADHPSGVPAQQWNPGTPLIQPQYSGTSGGGTAQTPLPVTQGWAPPPMAPGSANYTPGQSQSVNTVPGDPGAATNPSGGPMYPQPGGYLGYNPPQFVNGSGGIGGSGGFSPLQQVLGTAAFGLTHLQNRWQVPEAAANFYVGQQVGQFANQFTQPYWQTQGALASGQYFTPEDSASIQTSRWGSYAQAAGSVIGGIGGFLVGGVPGAMIGAGFGGAIAGGIGSGMAGVEQQRLQLQKSERLMRQVWEAGVGPLGTVHPRETLKPWVHDAYEAQYGAAATDAIEARQPRESLNLHGYLGKLFDEDTNYTSRRGYLQPSLNPLDSRVRHGRFGRPFEPIERMMGNVGGNLFPELMQAQGDSFPLAYQITKELVPRLGEQGAEWATKGMNDFMMGQYGAPLMADVWANRNSGGADPKMVGQLAWMQYLQGNVGGGNSMAAYGNVSPASQTIMRNAAVGVQQAEWQNGLSGLGIAAAGLKTQWTQMTGGDAPEIKAAMMEAVPKYQQVAANTEWELKQMLAVAQANPNIALSMQPQIQAKENELNQIRNQQRQATVVAPFQMEMGMASSLHGLRSTQAGAGVTMAQTFSGMPGAVQGAELAAVQEVSRYRMQLMEFEKQATQGHLLDLTAQRALQSEITQLSVAENVGRYQAAKNLSTNIQGLAGGMVSAGGAAAGYLQGAGFGAGMTTPLMVGMQRNNLVIAGEYKSQMANAATPQEQAAAMTGYYGTMAQIAGAGAQQQYGSIRAQTIETSEAAMFDVERLSTLRSEQGNLRSAQQGVLSAAQAKNADVWAAWYSLSPDERLNPQTALAHNRMVRSTQSEVNQAKQVLENDWTSRLVSWSMGLGENFSMVASQFNYANAVDHGVANRKFGGTAAQVAQYGGDPLWTRSFGGPGRSNTPEGILTNAFMYGGDVPKYNGRGPGFAAVNDPTEYTNWLNAQVPGGNMLPVPVGGIPAYTGAGNGALPQQKVVIDLTPAAAALFRVVSNPTILAQPANTPAPIVSHPAAPIAPLPLPVGRLVGGKYVSDGWPAVMGTDVWQDDPVQPGYTRKTDSYGTKWDYPTRPPSGPAVVPSQDPPPISPSRTSGQVPH